jgi:hypothetical protein
MRFCNFVANVPKNGAMELGYINNSSCPDMTFWKSETVLMSKNMQV